MAACNCQLVAGVVLIFIGTICNLSSNGARIWKFYDGHTVNVYYGLYDVCVETSLGTKCESINDPEGYVIGTRSMVSVPVILNCIACLLCIIHLCKVSKRTATKNLQTATVILVSIAVVLLVGANALYGALYQTDSEKYEFLEDKWELGSTFYLNVVAAVLLLIGALLMAFSYDPAQNQPLGNAVGVVQPVTVVYHIPGPSGYGQPAAGFAGPGNPPAYNQPQYPPGAQAPQVAYPAQPQPFAQPGPYPDQPQPFAQAAYGEKGGL